MRKSSKKAVILKNLINPFNTNDVVGEDQISLSIFSDVIGEMFKCGQFNFQSGDLAVLNNLVVPCEDFITVTITEHDGTQNDGHTIMIPCKP